MALQFEDISIPLTEGQDGSSDPSVIPLPKLIGIQNGEFDDRGNIQAMDGFTALPVTAMAGETAPSDANPTARRLLAHKNELLLETYQGTYRQQVGGSFALAAGKNNRKRDQLRCQRMGVTSIAEAQASQSDDFAGFVSQDAGVVGVDAAQLGDYTCTVWVEKYGVFPNAYAQVAWQIRHKTSDTLVGRGRIRDSVTNIVSEPRVVAFGGQFRIYAISGGDWGYIFIDPASTQNVNETLTKFTAGGAYTWLDVALSPTQVCVTVADNAPSMRSFIFNQATPTVAVGSPGVGVAGNPTPVAVFYVDTGGAGVNQAFVAFFACAGSFGTLRWFAVTPAAVSLGLGAQALATVVVGRPIAIKDYAGSAAAYPLLIDGVQAGGALSNFVVTSVQYNATAAAPGAMASVGTDTVIVREHICAGLPISVSGSPYSGTQQQGFLLPVQYASNTQNVFQVLDIARPLTQALVSNQVDANFSMLRVFDAGALFSTHIPSGLFAIGRVCSSVIAPDSGGLAAHFWCAKFTPNITNATQLGQNPTNIQRNTLSYVDKLGDLEFADLTYMAGGTPLIYDGQDICEEGFTFAPEAVSVTPAGAGGPLSAGVYSIVFVYEWFDGQGNRWQSQVGPPTAFTAVLANTYTAVVRSLRTTLKSGVQIIPYRTQVGGTIYRRDSPLGGLAAPLTDVALASSEPLYTGGVITFVGTQSNNALPGVKNFTVHQKRLVAVGGEFERGFFYSKERSLRFPAEFNRASGFGLVPEVTGRVAAASSFDDKLVLFAENGLSVIFGQGPNAAWAQNGYSTPVQIQAAEGIRFDSPQVGAVDDGVWYMTGIGPRLLSRGLATAKGPNGLPLGDEVRTNLQRPLGECSVFVHPSKSMVIFTSTIGADANTRYVYDYQRNRWSTSNFGAGISMASARGVLYSLTAGTLATNALKYEDPNNLDRNALTLTAGWVSFAGLSRFQRLSHLVVQCSQGNKTEMCFSFNVTLNIIGINEIGGLGQSSNVVRSVLVPENAPWETEFQVWNQTDTGYQISVIVLPAVGEPGGNFSITGLLARVGLKKGGPKLPASNRG